MTAARLLLGLAALAFAAGAQAQGGFALAGANPHGVTLDCASCHTDAGWHPLRSDPAFDHADDTGYVLEGRHDGADCQSCHLGLRFDGLEAAVTECGTCHLDVHRGALGSDCQTCHTPTDFRDVEGVAVHAGTAFPLTGSHLQVSCESCHADGVQAAAFAPLPTDCVACHADALASTASSAVPHVASGFPTDCQACHHTAAWAAGPFQHAAVSGGFDLVGAHDPLPCSACHTTPDFGTFWAPSAQDDCQSCHADDAAAATIDHSGFPTTCTNCHAADAWTGATADHVLLSGGFQLVGAHEALDCASCHTPDLAPIWTPAGQDDCLTCHATDFQATASGLVDHVAGGFPTTCLDCHTTDAWTGATFEHAAASGGFALVGAHDVLACASCHSGPGGEVPWAPMSQDDCQACHADDAAAASPSHAAFPTTCTQCHTTDGWAGATADHVLLSGGFALVGAHDGLDCAACHAGPDGEVPWTPSSQDDCLACHADDAATASPDHTGFPTTCTNCHSVDMWAGATVDHPQFPIYSGRHAGEWASCQTCHVQPGDFSVFSCVTCHEHNRPDMDDEHDEVGGYVYQSAACYSCHPDGEDRTGRKPFRLR